MDKPPGKPDPFTNKYWRELQDDFCRKTYNRDFSSEPVDSGFDDPKLPSTSIAPWPLAFTIFGLGLIGAVVYQIVSYVLR